MKLSEITEATDDKARFVQALKGNQKLILAYGEGSGRDLDIRGNPVTLDEWAKTMNFALSDFDGWYANFHADPVSKIISKYPDANKFKYIPAREGSVCLYIVGGSDADFRAFGSFLVKNKDAMEADELNYYKESSSRLDQPSIRLWWD